MGELNDTTNDHTFAPDRPVRTVARPRPPHARGHDGHRRQRVLAPGQIVLVLAYDSACSTCSAVSHRISQSCRGKLRTMPLSNQTVTAWRARAVPDAGWAPTLLEVRGRADADPDVRGWVGPAIGPALVRRLGIADAYRVTRALGQLRQEVADEATGRGRPRTVTRRSLIQAGAGAVAAFGILTETSTPAAAAAPGVRRSRTVTGTTLTADLPRVLAHTDLTNVAPAATLGRMREASAHAGDGHGQSVLRTSSAAGPAAGEDTVVSRGVHQLTSGQTMTTTAVAYGSGHALVLEEYSPARDGINAVAYRVQVTDDGYAHYDLYSTNGELDESLGQRVEKRAAAAPDCENPYPKDDPCGGCCFNGSGAAQIKRCQTSKVWECAFSAAACAGCASSCASGVGAAGCVSCLFSTCGSTVYNCCEKLGGKCSSSACTPA